MIYQLEIIGYPQERASKEFKKYMDEKFSISKSQIIHIQSKDNKKHLVYRINEVEKFQELKELQCEFNGIKFTFKEHKSDFITKINKILSERKREREEGKDYSRKMLISKIYLSNIPNILTEEIIRKALGRFGEIVETNIVEQPPKSSNGKKKENKFKFAVVKFKEFESAVAAFFEDKIEIKKKKAKVKLFIEEKGIKNEKRPSQNKNGDQKFTPRLENVINNFRMFQTNLGHQNIPYGRDKWNFPQGGQKFGNQTAHTAENPYVINHQLETENLRRFRVFKYKESFKREQFASDDLPMIKVSWKLEIPEVGINHSKGNLRMNFEENI